MGRGSEVQTKIAVAVPRGYWCRPFLARRRGRDPDERLYQGVGTGDYSDPSIQYYVLSREYFRHFPLAVEPELFRIKIFPRFRLLHLDDITADLYTTNTFLWLLTLQNIRQIEGRIVLIRIQIFST